MKIKLGFNNNKQTPFFCLPNAFFNNLALIDSYIYTGSK